MWRKINLPYYEFHYWPYDKQGNDKKYWELEEYPKEWAEHEVDVVNIMPYYDNYNIDWYFLELEAEDPFRAFVKAYNLVNQVININPIETYYRIKFLTASDIDGDERDWDIYPLTQDNLTHDLGNVYYDSPWYCVELGAPNPISAFNHSLILFDLFLLNKI